MIAHEQLQQLTQLGLNAYEAKAYLALLRKDSFSATQVADVSGVPRQRIYDILASLVERGLAISRPGRQGTKYTAVAPEIAIGGLLEDETRRVAALALTTSALIDTLGNQYQQGQQTNSPLDYIEVLRGQLAISQRFAEIETNCKREILIFTKPPYAKAPQDNVEGLQLLERHIRARSVYEYEALSDATMRRTIEAFMRRGAETRFVERIPQKLVIVDEEIVVFAMQDPIAGRMDLTVMIVENRQMAQLLKIAFNALWDHSLTYQQACARLGLPPLDAAPP